MAGRIVRMHHQNRPGPRPNPPLQLREVNPPAKVVEQRIRLQPHIIQIRQKVEQRIARLRDQHLIARVAQQPEQEASTPRSCWSSAPGGPDRQPPRDPRSTRSPPPAPTASPEGPGHTPAPPRSAAAPESPPRHRQNHTPSGSTPSGPAAPALCPRLPYRSRKLTLSNIPTRPPRKSVSCLRHLFMLNATRRPLK